MISRTNLLLVSVLGQALLACGPPPAPPVVKPEPAPPPEPVGPPEKDDVDTGMECMTALGMCDGGMCSVDVTNSCEAAVTCELAIQALCSGGTARGEARGKQRDTIGAGATYEMQAGTDCEGAAVVGTQIVSLSCR